MVSLCDASFFFRALSNLSVIILAPSPITTCSVLQRFEIFAWLDVSCELTVPCCEFRLKFLFTSRCRTCVCSDCSFPRVDSFPALEFVVFHSYVLPTQVKWNNLIIWASLASACEKCLWPDCNSNLSQIQILWCYLFIVVFQTCVIYAEQAKKNYGSCIERRGGAQDAPLCPMLSFQTVMDPEIEKSSCSSDHKALSWDLYCSYAEKELSLARATLGTRRWGKKRRGEAGGDVWMDKLAGWIARCGQILAQPPEEVGGRLKSLSLLWNPKNWE